MMSDVTAAGGASDLYRELILDHARSPRHFGKLEDTSHSAEGINPLCGDKLKLYLKIDPDRTISPSKFEGSGCAISVASASLLTETVRASAAMKHWIMWPAVGRSCLARKLQDNDSIWHKLKALAGVRDFPSRVKCATLRGTPWPRQ